MRVIRESCWREEALKIRYRDKDDQVTDRTIWPLAIVYFHSMLVVLESCYLHADFRIFRFERIESGQNDAVSFRPRRVALLCTYLARLENR